MQNFYYISHFKSNKTYEYELHEKVDVQERQQ